MIQKDILNCQYNFFQRGRHRGSRGQDDGASSDAAGSNFGNRAQERFKYQIRIDLQLILSSSSILLSNIQILHFIALLLNNAFHNFQMSK